MTTSIWWIRRDLRLTDNQALTAALAAADEVLPVFVLDRRLLESPYNGDKRTAFLYAGLRSLDEELRRLGSRLHLCSGDPAQVLVELCRETGAVGVYAGRDYSPFARARDALVAAATPAPLHLLDGIAARKPQSIHKEDGDPFVVYTPFSKRWRSAGPFQKGDILPAPPAIPSPAVSGGDEIPVMPELPATVPFVAGEAEAKRRLGAFAGGADAPIFRYGALRDKQIGRAHV